MVAPTLPPGPHILRREAAVKQMSNKDLKGKEKDEDRRLSQEDDARLCKGRRNMSA